MNARNLSLLIFCLIALSNAAIIAPTAQAIVVNPAAVSIAITSYTSKTKLELENLKKNADFILMVSRIRKFWEDSMSEILGDVTAVEEQAISGVNRRVTFDVKNGFTTKKVLVTVNLQPINSVMRVINTVPAIPGGIADADLTKIVLPKTENTPVSSQPLLMNFVPSINVISTDSASKVAASSGTASATSLRSEPVLISSTTTTATATTNSATKV